MLGLVRVRQVAGMCGRYVRVCLGYRGWWPWIAPVSAVAEVLQPGVLSMCASLSLGTHTHTHTHTSPCAPPAAKKRHPPENDQMAALVGGRGPAVSMHTYPYSTYY
jgi:hypothetical protein